MLTTTTPLVSGWFEAAREREAVGDPYWLYALSNGGSLLALIAYPLLIEPRLGLGAQRGVWAVGYVLLVVLLAVAASRAIPALRRADRDRVPAKRPTPRPTVGRDRRRDPDRLAPARPLAAARGGPVGPAVGGDDVHRHRPRVRAAAVGRAAVASTWSRSSSPSRRAASAGSGVRRVAAPAMITLLWVPYGSAGGWPVLAVLAMELVAFGIVATALHGRLAQDRPDPSRLTEFYLILSLGGALASAFVALVAPNVFPGVWELPILLVGALVGLALVAPKVAGPDARPARGLDFSPFFGGARQRMLPYVVAAALLVVALVVTGALATEAGIRWLLVGGVILLVGARPWFLALATAFVLALATFVLQPPAEFRDRSFFGVTEVLESPNGELTLLMNGTTVHGSQSTDPGASAGRRRATTSRTARSATSSRSPRRTPGHATVGVAGLGGGALATYADAATSMTFFEIDPVVIQVASDPALLHLPRGRTDPADRRRRRRPAVLRGRADRPLRPADHGCVLIGLRAGPPADRRGDRRRDPDHEARRRSSSSTSRTATTTSPRRSRPRSRRRA